MTSNDIEAHYTVDDLEQAIASALQALGKDMTALAPDDLAPVDEFHIRGREATAELATLVEPSPDTEILDVGSGLGGTARYLADRHRCRVIGVDLTEAYCALARRLSAWVGLSERTEFRCGDALRLPFGDGAFDLAWTEHAQMNIADKQSFYGEVHRVLRPGGRLAFHDVFAGEAGEVHFPVPWASRPALSALAPVNDVRRLLASTGFVELTWQDRTARALDWFRAALERIRTQGPPPLGIHLLMGEDSREKLVNMVRNLEEGRIAVAMAVVQRS
jgi:ubiquinone/menaquinone biosynthesis C-methylase UbiE